MSHPLANPIFLDQAWQMTIGERAVVEGILAQVAPRLAIEIGSAGGGALRRIVAHSAEVHAFDLVEPDEVPAGVTFHVGDSHEKLPEVLAELAAEGRNVDFVLVDGDHSAEGVRRDLEDLLDSPAIGHSVIVIHDTSNEEVRRGVDAVRFGAWPKVAHVDLDCVPGAILREEPMRNELWGGIGVVLVDVTRDAYAGGEILQQRAYPTAPILAEGRDRIVEREREEERERAALQRRRDGEPEPGEDDEAEPDLEAEVAALRAEVERRQRVQHDLETSISWRLTAPLRSAKRRLGARRS